MTKVEIGLPGQAGADAVALPVAQPLGSDGAKIVDDKLGGRRFCFLYTDLANPTSNAIYERIGYRRVAESAEIVFS